LRNFARLDEAEVRQTNLHECLESTLTLVHHELKNRISVRKEFGDIPLVPCHASQISQVFMNLLVNASHAIQGSGEVTIRTCCDGPWVKIQVSDTGSGIAPENLPRIFDAGFTTKGAGVGTGLGLAICQKIIQDHNGSIAVESKVGKGTTFTVCLPIEWKISHLDSDASQS
jgi:signal transduction histidine kinase